MDYLKLKEQYETGKFSIEYKPKSEQQWKRTDDVGVFFLSPDGWDVKLVENKLVTSNLEHEESELEKSYNDVMLNGNSMMRVSTEGIEHISRYKWEKPVERITREEFEYVYETINHLFKR